VGSGRGWRRFLGELLDPARAPILYILFTVLLAAPGNGFYQILQERYGTTRALALGATIVVFLALVQIGVGVYRARLVARSGVLALVPAGAEASGAIRPRQGLIVLVSQAQPGKSGALAAIQHHELALRYLCLLHTRPPEQEPGGGYQSSATLAHTLQATYQDRFQVRLLEIQDQDNPVEVYNLAQFAYQEAKGLGLKVGEIVADVTGGTKAMSIGLAYAGLPASRTLQYLKPNSYLPDGRANPDEGSTPGSSMSAWSIPTTSSAISACA